MQVRTRASERVRIGFGDQSGGRGENNSMLHDLTLPCSSEDFGRIILPIFGTELAQLAGGSPKKQHQARTVPWHDEGKWSHDNGGIGMSLAGIYM
jgi:hypothetical protein